MNSLISTVAVKNQVGVINLKKTFDILKSSPLQLPQDEEEFDK